MFPEGRSPAVLWRGIITAASAKTLGCSNLFFFILGMKVNKGLGVPGRNWIVLMPSAD